MTHSLIKNQDNHVICNFCNNVCEFSLKEWCKCFICQVWYNTSQNSIQFLAVENSKMYAIHILLEENKSNIYKYYNRGSEGYDLVTSFDYLLSVTPTNLQEKLKTYLLFL